MWILRYSISLSLGGLLTILVFVAMQHLLSFKQLNIKHYQNTQHVDFVKLIRDPPPIQRKKRTPPKKPVVKKNKTQPPKLDRLQVSKPTLTSTNLPKFNPALQLNTSDALYLGKFKKNRGIGKGVKIDEEVIPLVRIAPRYPRNAARRGIEGWVKVKITINKLGQVIDAKVIDAQPKRIFNRAAIKAIKKWKFRPKVVNGKAVPRIATQKMKFELQ
ncbi:MAG: energy transducer TonB [Methylococcales bacterium]|jgi:periplasmic protein TonB|nr:energy transducer TonB [Methylococcales bacterium]MBT7408259.1 energy transducer TonB [Methylococcales bacterium]